jgi:hypothetical protein
MARKRLHEAPRPRHYFGAAGVAASLVLGTLIVGILGYHYLDRLPWIDAMVDASMILAGMGPVSPLKYEAAKFFASAYALFSGLLFVGVCGILSAPWVHLFLHRFHADLDDD